MVSTLLDKVNLVAKEQPLNVETLIVVTPFGILKTPSTLLFRRLRPLQPWKAYSPIDVVELGIIIVSINEQFLNAAVGITVCLVIVTFLMV